MDRPNETGLSLADRIRAEVLSWPEVSAGEHEFGGVEFRVGTREIGHLHDDLHLADLPFSKRVRAELVAAGRAMPHHIFPESGWVSYEIAAEGSLTGALELFRRSYEGAMTAQRRDEGDGA